MSPGSQPIMVVSGTRASEPKSCQLDLEQDRQVLYSLCTYSQCTIARAFAQGSWTISSDQCARLYQDRTHCLGKNWTRLAEHSHLLQQTRSDSIICVWRPGKGKRKTHSRVTLPDVLCPHCITIKELPLIETMSVYDDAIAFTLMRSEELTISGYSKLD